MTRRLVDLSHTVEDGMITYRGIPAPVIRDWLSREASRARYAPGTEFQIGHVELAANTGTYLDSPFHRFPDGEDLAGLRLDQVAELDGVVIRAPVTAGRVVGVESFAGRELEGKAVLIHTGWDVHWRTDRYSEGHPYLTEAAALHLVGAGATLVGIDSLNIDDTADGTRPVHTTLLGAGVPIVEHLRGLEQIPDSGFRFSAVAVKVKGCGSFPVRAFASFAG